ncbi:amino acid permease, partial [Burkholderia pseudomallei]
LGLVRLLGVGLSGCVDYVFSLLKSAALVAFIALGACFGAAARASSGICFANYSAHGGFFPIGLSGVWVAVIVAIFSYMSIETVAIATVSMLI